MTAEHAPSSEQPESVPSVESAVADAVALGIPAALADLGDLGAGFLGDARAAALARARSFCFTSDATAAFTSSMVEDQPKLARKAQRASASSTPIASSTWLIDTLPDEQVEPELIATPSRSSAISAVSAVRPGMAKPLVLHSRVAPAPKITVCGMASFSAASK